MANAEIILLCALPNVTNCCTCALLPMLLWIQRFHAVDVCLYGMVPGQVGCHLCPSNDIHCMRALRFAGNLNGLGGLAGLLILYIMIRMRGHLRRKYQIYGDDCNDALTTCCCLPCSAIQMAREVETEECCMQCSEGEEYAPNGQEVVVAMIV